MGLRKESDKYLQMEKKETAFQRENDKSPTETESGKPLKQRSNQNKLSKEFSKGVESFREELEKDDYGVEATNTIVEKSHQTGKGVKKVVSEIHKKRKENTLRKAEDEQLKSVQQKLGNEIKNKQKHTTSKLINEESKGKNNFLKKVMAQPKKMAGTAKNKGIQSYRESLESDDEGVKVGTKGTELVKDGVKSLSHARKVRRKNSAAQKLKGHSSKLTTDGKLRKATLNPNMRKGQKALQKKRIMRANIYKQKAKKPLSIPSLTKKTGLSLKNGYRAVRKAVSMMVRKVMGTKVMAVIGASFIKLLPVFAIVGGIVALMVIIMSLGGGGGKEEMDRAQGTLGLDPAVEQWRDLVTEVADEKGMSDYVGLILAIIQIESGGKGTDIMQSSESAGYAPNHFKDERKSVEQGVKHLKNVVNVLGEYSDKYLDDHKLIAQTYNFGLGFARHVGGKNLDGYDIEVSESYSKDIVAVSLGNLSGETYEYNNPIADKVGKNYLYRNGGNFLYGELVGEYIGGGGDGEMFPPVDNMIVTSHFGNRSSPGGIGSTNHKGIDLDCTGGVTPIRSLKDGSVVKSQYVNGLGNTVVVKHDDYYTTYGHMSSLTAKQGQTVNAGDELGVCGSTGNSTGPHLHLEISPKPHQNQVDPYPYIKHLIGG